MAALRAQQRSAEEQNYARMRAFTNFLFDRLIATFPQGLFEAHRVTRFRCNLDGLIDLYTRKNAKGVTIIPAGLKYESHFYAPANLPLPLFKFPFPGTEVTLTFGQPRLLNKSAVLENLTETVMREAAALSGLSYNGEPLLRKRNKPRYA